jgi:putative hydrolase of the HAD superfamily
MKKIDPVVVRVLFLDVGGVLLTDAWDRYARKRAAAKFKLDLVELNERHHLLFENYEAGKFSLDEYLDLLIFYQKRKFTKTQFRSFIFEQSKPYPEMLQLAQELAKQKGRRGFRIAILNNEGKELNDFRIQKFKLDKLADFFISSNFVHLRKPDTDIFRLALSIAQVPAHEVVYVENTPMFVQIGEDLGMRCILHTDYQSTRDKLAAFGLPSINHLLNN